MSALLSMLSHSSVTTSTALHLLIWLTIQAVHLRRRGEIQKEGSDHIASASYSQRWRFAGPNNTDRLYCATWLFSL
ncbi:hypothetical protein K438DRAFT_487120 [Mycena galopus ATCC 62051]|nr:hypothetical protein K438DRAFT_487120 [Mycena galopus ATCC 62051]